MQQALGLAFHVVLVLDECLLSKLVIIESINQSIFGRKKFLVEKNLGRKNLWVEKNFWSKKNFG